jgi:hypothetical protein
MKDNELIAFKNQIFLYGIGIALIFEVISLPFLGFDRGFAYGLALGTAISIVNFNLLAFTLGKVLENGSKTLAFIGYMVRLCLYGLVFYVSMRVSLWAGAGSVLGFVVLKIAMYYLHGFKAKFSKGRKVRPETDFPEKKKKRFLGGLFEWSDASDEEDAVETGSADAAVGANGADAADGASAANAANAAGSATAATAADAAGRINIKGKTYIIHRRYQR